MSVLSPILRLCLLALLCPLPSIAQQQRFEKPPHDYWNRPLNDPFSLWLGRIAKGEAQMPTGDEITVMRELLKIFDVPVTSQMIVFSATSRQPIISPYRPRALYFGDEIYLGYVPGGRIEVASIDPQAGPVFHIFDFPRGDRASIRADRSTKCMECHAGFDNHEIPKLVIDSVAVNRQGGALETWRRQKSGHDVPLSERFGGWHLTGALNLGKNHANTLGQLSEGKLTLTENPPGKLFNLARYPLATSDILPQLLHDHQAGFINLLTEANYKVRELTAPEHGALTAADEKELDRHADEIAAYILFQKEAKLPAGGITGDAAYIKDFQANRRAITGDHSLKEFDLKTRLFRYRCSYMIYTNYWASLPALIKDRCWKRLRTLLSRDAQGCAAWLPPIERAAIRKILAGTLPESPQEWQ
ncbi:MAG TPA: hypothetical protein VG796_28880 [Verrucomicrobiales bacterium]|jgi:hypothetical protein|nr:hypothetical protein [Verrucomicrobiales bacterium]